MKKVLFLLILGLTSYFGQAQTLTTIDLDTMTNADTVLNEVNGRTYPLDYEFYYTASSLSGTLLDTILVQKAAHGTTDWITANTIAISALNTTWKGIATGSCLGCKFRIYSKSTGTQSTSIKTSMVIYRQLN